MSVIAGESVVLQNDATELQKDDLIVWRFGDKGVLLAKIDVETNKRSLNDDDDRFRNRTTTRSNWISDHHERQNRTHWTL